MAAPSSAPKAIPDVMAGETFGKYVLMKRLAMGGMAEVSLARLQGAAGFNKLVVIKQVHPAFAESEQFVEMFLDEGRLAAKLSHPNIAQTFELGEEAGRHYLAMEYVPGESLYAVLKRTRERGLMLPLGCALRIVMQLLEALDYAHDLTDESGAPLQLVHRDVTPSNVMVTHQGAIKLLDFGIARATTQLHVTEAGRVKGKGGYMAPEQCRSSKVDARADVYGAGAVLYLMTTGSKPYEHLPHGTDLVGQMNATMEGSFRRPRDLRPDLHFDLERIILRAMALKPDDRYQSAGAMLEDLERFAATAGVFPSPRELGEFVRRLFPVGADGVRESTPAKATPVPVALRAAKEPGAGAEVSGATELRKSRAAQPDDAASEEDTAANVLASPVTSQNAVPSRVVLLAAAGAVLLALGIIAAVNFGSRASEATAVAGAAPKPVPVVQPPQALTPPVAVSVPAVEAQAQDAAPVPVEAAVAPELANAEAAKAAPTKAEAVKVEPTKARHHVPAAAAAAPSKAAPAMGALEINAYPWAKVRVKGKELGVTPLKVSLAPGTYDVELENPVVNVKRTVSLVVKENEETKHFEKLSP